MNHAQPGVNKSIKFTYEDYCLYPTNGKQLQLIEGEFFMSPAPKTYHQKVSGNIEFILRRYVYKHNLGEIYDAPTDVRLSSEDVVQPDILFISKSRLHIITKNYIKDAPDLVVEILSDKTKKIDLKLKRALYAKHGVKEYWIVDPDRETADVLDLGEKGYTEIKKYKAGQTLISSVLKGLKIKVEEIFKK